MEQNKVTKWDYAHFPKGSVVSICVGAYDVSNRTRTLTVKHIVQNAPDSYVLVGEEIDGSTGSNIAYNTDHTVKILKRGSGPIVFEDKESNTSYYKKHCEEMNMILKHHSRYKTYAVRAMIHLLINDLLSPDVVLDMDKLISYLIARNYIITTKYTGVGISLLSGNKKKIKKAVRQVFNKCLISKKKAQRDYDKSFEEDYDNGRSDEEESLALSDDDYIDDYILDDHPWTSIPQG